MMEVTISDEECKKYAISREMANEIVTVIKGFANELYDQKQQKTLLTTKKDFPKEAMKYNRDKNI